MSDDEYTPLDHEMRGTAIGGARDALRLSEVDAEARWDRWLAAHDRQVAARALRDAADELSLMDEIESSEEDWLRERAGRIVAGEGL